MLHMFTIIYVLSYKLVFFFFFLMIRRPPRSTPFPTRRSSDLPMVFQKDQCEYTFKRRGGGKWRSEEHTSELQSQSNLVCRLLLEKKKKKKNKKNKQTNTLPLC